MGLFKALETSAAVYNPANDNTNDTIKYPSSASSNINMLIIRLNPSEVNVLGEEFAEYEANPSGDFTGSILKDAKIVQGGKIYKVVNEPHYRPLMKYTKIELKRVTNEGT